VLQFVLTAVFVVGCLAYIVIRSRRQAGAFAPLGPSAARTTGTIVSVKTRVPDLRSPEGPLPPLNFPVVRFQDAAGQPVTFQSAIGWTRGPKAGQSVKVAYDPADPQNARLDGHEGRSFHAAATVRPGVPRGRRRARARRRGVPLPSRPALRAAQLLSWNESKISRTWQASTSACGPPIVKATAAPALVR